MSTNTGKSRSAMLSEIYEQPKALLETIQRHVDDAVIFPGELNRIEGSLSTFSKMIIAASGSSRHAGLAGEIMIEDLSGTPVDVEYSSEYCYRSTHATSDPLVVVISQSGETTDTTAAQREALTRGASTIAICNVAESTIVREATTGLVTYAGPEKAVPATKSFTTQLAVLHLLALFLARKRGRMTSEVIRTRLQRMLELPEEIDRALPAWDKVAEECASHYYKAPTFLYAGRGVHHAIAREGALKLKETSYAHAEGYPTGEISHGPQALVNEHLPIVALATCDANDPDSVLRYRKSLPILAKIKKDGGKLIVVANQANRDDLSFADHVIVVPQAPELLLPLVEVIPLQLFAYYVATMNGHDVDRPRHLAKAVIER